MNEFLKEILRCPFCNSSFNNSDYSIFEDQGGYGILRCDCRAIPVVDSIPILSQRNLSATNVSVEYIMDLIGQKKFSDALLALLLPPPPSFLKYSPAIYKYVVELRAIRYVKRKILAYYVKKWTEEVTTKIANKNGTITARDIFDIHFNQSGLEWREAHNYFAFRFGQPRHIVALSLASVINHNNDPILDLACGFGHITFNLTQNKKNQPVIGIDREFFPLYIANKWMVPDGIFICSDVNDPLPFPDNIFAGMMCTDGIHYIKNKTTCIRESRRVCYDDGVIILSSSRNKLVKFSNTGMPLSPNGYLQLLQGLNYRMVSDNEILDRYFKKLKPNLEQSLPVDSLSPEPLISIVISEKDSYFIDHGELSEWPHAKGTLTVNPIYKATGGKNENGAVYNLAFPSPEYKNEHTECLKYMPKSVVVDSSLISSLPDVPYIPEVDDLVKKCFIIGVPEFY